MDRHDSRSKHAVASWPEFHSNRAPLSRREPLERKEHRQGCKFGSSDNQPGIHFGTRPGFQPGSFGSPTGPGRYTPARNQSPWFGRNSGLERPRRSSAPRQRLTPRRLPTCSVSFQNSFQPATFLVPDQRRACERRRPVAGAIPAAGFVVSQALRRSSNALSTRASGKHYLGFGAKQIGIRRFFMAHRAGRAALCREGRLCGPSIERIETAGQRWPCKPAAA